MALQLVDLKSELQDDLMGFSVIDQLPDPKIRKAIQDFDSERVKAVNEKINRSYDGFDDDLHWEGLDFLASNFGMPEELLLKHQSVSTLIATSEIPSRVRELLGEAKVCYMMGQQNAVMAIGRMMLEFAITDIAVRSPMPESTEDIYKFLPFQRADSLLGETSRRRKTFQKLYGAGSKAIHSSKENAKYSPIEFLEAVLEFIENEYAINLRK